LAHQKHLLQFTKRSWPLQNIPREENSPREGDVVVQTFGADGKYISQAEAIDFAAKYFDKNKQQPETPRPQPETPTEQSTESTTVQPNEPAA